MWAEGTPLLAGPIASVPEGILLVNGNYYLQHPGYRSGGEALLGQVAGYLQWHSFGPGTVDMARVE